MEHGNRHRRTRRESQGKDNPEPAEGSHELLTLRRRPEVFLECFKERSTIESVFLRRARWTTALPGVARGARVTPIMIPVACARIWVTVFPNGLRTAPIKSRLYTKSPGLTARSRIPPRSERIH